MNLVKQLRVDLSLREDVYAAADDADLDVVIEALDYLDLDTLVYEAVRAKLDSITATKDVLLHVHDV